MAILPVLDPLEKRRMGGHTGRMRPVILLGLCLCLTAARAQGLTVSAAAARLREAPASSPEEAVAGVFALMRRVIIHGGDSAPRGPHEWSAEQSLGAGSVNGCVESAKVFFALFKTAYPSFDAAYVDSFNSSGPGGHAVVEVTGSDGRPFLVDATPFSRLPGVVEVTEAELSRPIDIRPESKGRILQFPGKADVLMEKEGAGYHAVVYDYMGAFGPKRSEQTFDSLGELNRWLGGFSGESACTAPTFSDIKRLGLILPYDDHELSSFQYVNAKHVIYGCYRALPAQDEAERVEPGARLAFGRTGRGMTCGAAAVKPGR